MKIKLSQAQWQSIGTKTGWIKQSDDSNEPEDPMAVAKTILHQLGGNKFLAMTGAKNLVGSSNSLSFRLPGSGGFTKNGINVVRITLDPSDTYTIEFGRIRGTNYKIINTHYEQYADQLRDIFTEETGLQTSL